MNREAIVRLLEQSGLEAYRESLESLIFPTCQLRLQPDEDPNLPVGCSKVGGHPDLPDDVEWPRWKHYNQSFIAQMNMADLPPELELPQEGLLTFFYAVEAMYEDEEFYNNPGTCSVIYSTPERLGGLRRTSSPGELDEGAVLRPNRIEFVPGLCVPAAESAYLEKLGLGWTENREDFEKYWSVFLEKLHAQGPPDDYIHRLLGHPDQIQGDMQFYSEMIATGLSYDSLREPASRSRMLPSALRWRLLLQIDSEEEKTGIMWGDVGRIYYWIREEDLAALRFDRVVCQMQCG